MPDDAELLGPSQRALDDRPPADGNGPLIALGALGLGLGAYLLYQQSHPKPAAPMAGGGPSLGAPTATTATTAPPTSPLPIQGPPSSLQALPSLTPAAATLIQQAATTAVSLGQEPPAEAAPGLDYTVQPGDSIYSIATYYCGDPTFYDRLYADNPYAWSPVDGSPVQYGETIFIRQPCLHVPGFTAQTAAAPVAQPASSLGQPISYTVQSGDSLSSIATAYCSDPSAWTWIWSQNQGILDHGFSPDGSPILYIGDVLTFSVPCGSASPAIAASPSGFVSTPINPGFSTPAGCQNIYQTTGGETLAQLAGRYFGNSGLGSAIAQANPGYTFSPNTAQPLTPGLSICIPATLPQQGPSYPGPSSQPRPLGPQGPLYAQGGATCPDPRDFIVEVFPGETWAQIASQENVDARTLASYNGFPGASPSAGPTGGFVCLNSGLTINSSNLSLGVQPDFVQHAAASPLARSTDDTGAPWSFAAWQERSTGYLKP